MALTAYPPHVKAAAYAKALALAAASPKLADYVAANQTIAQPKPRTSSPTTTSARDGLYLVEQKICEAIQLDVLGKTGRTGVKVFSLYYRRSEVIQDITRLSYEQLILIAGPPVKEFVHKSSVDDKEDMWSISQVRDAIALLGGRRQIGDQTELGVGCWGGRAPNGEPYPSVVLVNKGEAAEWNGDMKLIYVDHPRCRGHLLNFEGDDDEQPWYRHNTLAPLVEQCDADFVASVRNELINLFEQWRWRHQGISPVVMTGLVLATWMQTLWQWRPQVAIVGASQAGKTTLFRTVEAMFGSLCDRSDSSSAAGIRQTIATSARIMLCDEIEKNKYRSEILEMLRMAGAGSYTRRGTTGNKSVRFGLRHIVWIGAIESGLKEVPDMNRFITLELIKPSREDRGKLRVPDAAHLRDLGQRSLAVAIRHIHRAAALAVTLKDTRIPDVDGRVIESYAVPTAMMSAIEGFDDHQARELLVEIIDGMSLREDGEIKDENSLLGAILSAHVIVSKESYSVAQLIDLVIAQNAGYDLAEAGLEKVGLAFGKYARQDALPSSELGTFGEPATIREKGCLLVAYDAVERHLLRGTPWSGKSIDQVLARIPGAIRSRRRIGGQRCRVVLIPRVVFDAEFLGIGTEQYPSIAMF